MGTKTKLSVVKTKREWRTFFFWGFSSNLRECFFSSTKIASNDRLFVVFLTCSRSVQYVHFARSSTSCFEKKMEPSRKKQRFLHPSSALFGFQNTFPVVTNCYQNYTRKTNKQIKHNKNWLDGSKTNRYQMEVFLFSWFLIVEKIECFWWLFQQSIIIFSGWFINYQLWEKNKIGWNFKNNCDKNVNV